MHTLVATSHRHDERLMAGIDRLPEVGDMIGNAAMSELEPALHEAVTFLTGVLVPHVDAQQAALYPECERLLQNRHSMTPMVREHVEIKQLVGRIEGLSQLVKSRQLGPGEALELRRLLFRLYSLLKVHLAEEELFVSIVDHNVGEDRGIQLAQALEHIGATQP